MKKKELVNNIYSSPLGFGCASVLGAVDAQKSKRAIHCALDCGINYFDLARSYGYGEAEKFLGQILKGKRNDVVISSKFGITANWKAQILKPVKPIIRHALNAIKRNPNTDIHSVSNIVKPNRFHKHVAINPQTMIESLNKSLKALSTDYLDCFFIHEPQDSLFMLDDLINISEKLKAQGKIRSFGLSFMRTQSSLHLNYINKFDLLQFDNSPGSFGYEQVVEDRGIKPNVLFSALKSGSPNLTAQEKLEKLFKDFPDSVILCSMFNENHIKANAALLR